MSSLTPARESVDPATTLMSETDFERWLRRRVDEREPAAVVRFGTGEARLLTASPDDAESMRTIVRHLEEEIGLSPAGEDVQAIKDLVAVAYEEADVLGIRFDQPSLDIHELWMTRLFEDYCRRLATGRPPAALAHCLLSDDIVNALPELLAGRPVSVISCRDLKPVLEGEWGLDDVAVYQVPSQHTVRDVDGSYEAAMYGVPIWPDGHARLHEQVRVRTRGEVFLVGAGFFGKDLCIRVRDQGGIALDMGSVLDRVAGKITRGPERRVLDLHANGMPIEAIAARLQRFYGVRVSSNDVVEVLTSTVSNDLAAWRGRPLEAAYRALCIDALRVEIGEAGATRERTCYVTLGVTAGGFREPLGIWWQDDAGADLWSAVLGDLRRRGVRDLPSICADSVQEPLARAAERVFPHARLRAAAEPIASSASIRRALAAHGRFADEQAATMLIYPAFSRAEAAWRNGHPDSPGEPGASDVEP